MNPLAMIIGLFFLVFAASGAEKNTVLEENFDGTEQMPSTLEGISRGASLSKVPGGKEGERLLVLEPNSSAIFKAVELDPGTKYRLSFRARSSGPDSLEKNPQLEEAFYDANRSSKGMKLPMWSLNFSSAERTYCNTYILFPYHKVILSENFRICSDVFYPAPGSTRMKIRFENPSPENTLFIDDLKVEVFTESALNINPEFKLGKFNHSGFGQAGYGIDIRMTERPDGKGFFLNVNSWASCDPVPVKGGKNYVFEARLAPNPPRGARIQITFFDKEMKEIRNAGGSVPVKKAEGSGKGNFIAPDNAAFARMLIYGGKDCAFEYIRMTQQDMEMDQ